MAETVVYKHRYVVKLKLKIDFLKLSLTLIKDDFGIVFSLLGLKVKLIALFTAVHVSCSCLTQIFFMLFFSSITLCPHCLLPALTLRH